MLNFIGLNTESENIIISTIYKYYYVLYYVHTTSPHSTSNIVKVYFFSEFFFCFCFSCKYMKDLSLQANKVSKNFINNESVFG